MTKSQLEYIDNILYNVYKYVHQELFELQNYLDENFQKTKRPISKSSKKEKSRSTQQKKKTTPKRKKA